MHPAIRRFLRISSLVLLVLSAFSLIVQASEKLVLRLLLKITVPGSASSIGIIGGADGPTAVFVTRTARSGWLHILLPIAVIAAAIIVLRKTKK